MQKEIWKDIPDYEGLYQVSNLGRVKSFKRNKYKILSCSKNSDGYKNCQLRKNLLGKSFKVHQLVAMAFLNHKPCKYKYVIDHINNDRLDNKLENLQIISNRENCSKDKKNKSSKYTGVSWCKKDKKWISSIRKNGNKIRLGGFNCELKAHLIYQIKLKENEI